MNLNPYLDVAPEVAAAVAAGKPVVALESTIISHGMPYPQNVETALKVEQIIRDNGAVPATIAILGGRLKAGLTAEEIEYLGKNGPGRDQGQPPGSGGAGLPQGRRRHHRHHHHDDRPHGRHPGVRHRRHRRRAPRRRDHHGHLRRSGGAGLHPRDGGVRRGQVHPGSGPHPGVPGDPRRARPRLRHRGAARLLHPQERLRGGLPGGHPRGARRGLPGAPWIWASGAACW